MNDMTPTEPGQSLALPQAASLELLLKSGDGPKALLNKIAAEARAEAKRHDAATPAGRKALISLANKASQSRAEAIRQAKSITEQWRKDTSAVNAGRKVLEDGLAELRDELRGPVTAWEEAEDARKAAHIEAMAVFDTSETNAMNDPDAIRDVIAAVEAAPLGDCWEEFEEEAAEKRRAALDWHRNNLAVAEKRAADEAELAKLRTEAEERARKDAEEAERKAEAERAAAQAEADRIAAEKAEQRRIEAEKAETERQKQAERDKAEAAERARIEAEERAKAEAKAAEERHARELAEAKAREERAAQAERDRIAAEEKRAADERAKREADEAHRARILADINAALLPIPREDIGRAMMDGRVPHVEVAL